ncbi:hypothetical protein B0I35DRAFT_455297 [Stachybotrys elegans]|uniref:CFEM domain-containing protein n=1 Tax=Stachybotrys elegans TaxID=80388 RepID=A0A8K0WKC0_9HYPO|nr:hypothetical protein B0I35DRAFT_455297 [Stachybotrys elegans]
MSSNMDLLTHLPESALSCVIDAVTQSTCQVTDFLCICQNVELNAQAASCIQANCTIREGLTAMNVTNTMCGVESTQDRSYEAALIAFMVLACLAVVLRIAVRILRSVNFWWDDACNLIALVRITIHCPDFPTLGSTDFPTDMLLRHQGMGYDIWAHYYVNFIMYATSRLFIRLSIVLFFLRIFGLTSARALLIFTVFLITCSSLSFIFSLIFQCTPVNYFWLRWDGESRGSCIDLGAFMRVTAILAICVDFWQLLVAIPFVVRLKISLKKKLLVVVMFTVGIIVIIISIIRYPTIEDFTQSHNLTRDIIPVGFWSAIELDVGVICACLPSLQVLLKSCSHKTKSTSSGPYLEMSPVMQRSKGHSRTKPENQFLESKIQKTTEIYQERLDSSEVHLQQTFS